MSALDEPCIPLQPESLDPVFELMEELSRRIHENDQAIDKLTKYIDLQFFLPELPPSSTTTAYKSHDPINEKDFLRDFLEEKYNLNQIEVNSDEINITNPRIKALIDDNLKLRAIKKQKGDRNREIINLIRDYESFIVERLVPSLVSKSDQLHHIGLIRDEVSSQISNSNEIWQNYVKYLELKSVITEYCNKTICILDSMTENEDLGLLDQQLSIIKDLRLYIVHSKYY